MFEFETESFADLIPTSEIYDKIGTLVCKCGLFCRRNGAARDAMRAGGDSEAHNFQEYTYKKITPCDVCSQVLRGKK